MIAIRKCQEKPICEQNETILNDKIKDIMYTVFVFDKKIDFKNMTDPLIPDLSFYH